MNNIDGREISTDIANAWEYAEKILGMSEEAYDTFVEESEEAYALLSRLIALMYAHKLLRHTSHICGSLVASTRELIFQLKDELQEKYDIEFQLEQFNWY